MAILIYGMSCLICGEPMHEGQDLFSFPPFVSNRKDPLWLFDDAAVHTECLRAHPLGKTAEMRLERYMEAREESPPRCALCSVKIAEPDEYFTFGHLTDDPANPLSRYNFRHYHRHCLAKSREFPEIRAHLIALGESGEWDEAAIDWLDELRQCAGE